MVVLGSGEINLPEDSPECLVPASSALLKPVDCLPQLKDLVVSTDSNFAGRRLHIDYLVLLQLSVEVGGFDVHLMDFPIVPGCER